MTRKEILQKYRNVLDYLDMITEVHMDRDDIARFVQQIIKDIEDVKAQHFTCDNWEEKNEPDRNLRRSIRGE